MERVELSESSQCKRGVVDGTVLSLSDIGWYCVILYKYCMVLYSIGWYCVILYKYCGRTSAFSIRHWMVLCGIVQVLYGISIRHCVVLLTDYGIAWYCIVWMYTDQWYLSAVLSDISTENTFPGDTKKTLCNLTKKHTKTFDYLFWR